jgi:magnesium chelatase family protein
VEVPRLSFDKLTAEARQEEGSASIKKRVCQVRQMQSERFRDEPYLTNSEMSSEAVKKYCQADDESRNLLKNAVDHMHLSARGYFRVLKLARTIADLAGADRIAGNHVAEALQYRPQEN